MKKYSFQQRESFKTIWSFMASRDVRQRKGTKIVAVAEEILYCTVLENVLKKKNYIPGFFDTRISAQKGGPVNSRYFRMNCRGNV